MRTRSLSSNSGPGDAHARSEDTAKHAAWLLSSFGVRIANMSAISRWLNEHQALIAREQASISCRHGFSCLQKARDAYAWSRASRAKLGSEPHSLPTTVGRGLLADVAQAHPDPLEPCLKQAARPKRNDERNAATTAASKVERAL